MDFKLKKDRPRPWGRVHAGVAPGRDARWASANGRDRIDTVRLREQQRRERSGS